MDNMPFWFRVVGWLLLPLMLSLLVIAVTSPKAAQKITSSGKTDCLSRGGAWAKAYTDSEFRCVRPLEEMK